MFEQLGGRKLLFGMVLLLVGIGIVALKGDISSGMLDLMKFLFGSFVVGNSIGTVAGAVQGSLSVTNNTPASTNTVDLTPINTHLDDLKVADSTLAQSVSLVQQTLSLIIKKLQIDKMPDPPAS